GPREVALELERAAVVPDRLVDATRFGERDGHVLENARIVGVIAQGQPVRRERRLEIALAFEGERLVEIVEALRCDVVCAQAAEQAAPETHGPKIACGRVTVQCSFSPDAAPAAHSTTPQLARHRPQDAAWRARGGLAVFRGNVPRA